MSLHFDHRQLAEDMALYCMNEDVGGGLPLWLPNGCAVREKLEKFMKDLERRAGYRRVCSPHIAKAKLYEISGHLKFYKPDMFPEMKIAKSSSDSDCSELRDSSESYYLRPMNCPHHHKIFDSQPRSYRDLPLRLAEYGQVYRYEKSGALRGLSRVRGLCQNDGHIYVAQSGAAQEVSQVLELHENAYRLLGLQGYRFRLSLRDSSKPLEFEGSENKWLEAEGILRDALKKRGVEFSEEVGEAAFYGPKIDIQMPLGSHEESISSIQLDPLSGERFDLRFVAQDGSMEVPWIIHRAPLGSHERFIALMLEYFEGRLPDWLAPVSVAIVPVHDNDLQACRALEIKLINADISAHVESSRGSLAKRVEKAHRLRPVCKILLGARDIARGIYVLEYRDERIECAEIELMGKLKAKFLPPL